MQIVIDYITSKLILNIVRRSGAAQKTERMDQKLFRLRVLRFSM